MASDRDERAALEELKEAAFEEPKAELRDHADAREFLQLLRLSKEEPLEGESLADEVTSLLERC